ncbi:siderophore-interacting protein [Pseudoalteromonas arctica]|uniref:Siderophore-interacting protein n=1 Tax=Pseudoalteromonas arctica TaxID=394751 RepID=A0A7Y0DQJ6_9GAMM|nr:siderophore-interacting protein [Pseudoalteromonas arctica]NMM39685.1 siderophore-interacting protein [Pseudoalteromonas arctica]
MSRKVRRATVISTTAIAPHLKRLVVGSDEFHDFPADQQGAYVKVLLPHTGQDEVEIDLKAAEPAPKRSYTIRAIDTINHTITLDFVVNQHRGIATDWAKQAKAGDKLAIAGPGPKKLDDFSQLQYLMIADLTSVNAINGYLQQLPATADVDVIIHVADSQDIIRLDTIEAHTQHRIKWLVTTEPQTELVEQIADYLNHYIDTPLIFMGLEGSLVRTIQNLAKEHFAVPSAKIVCSAYWKRGIDADGKQAL